MLGVAVLMGGAGARSVPRSLASRLERRYRLHAERIRADADREAFDELVQRTAPRLALAAARAGVGHIVYPSIVGIDDHPFPYYRAKLAAERATEPARAHGGYSSRRGMAQRQGGVRQHSTPAGGRRARSLYAGEGKACLGRDRVDDRQRRLPCRPPGGRRLAGFRPRELPADRRRASGRRAPAWCRCCRPLP